MPRSSTWTEEELATIRRNIQAFRKEHGWSQADLAAVSGVALSSIQRYERTKHSTPPDGQAMFKLARAFGRSVDDLTSQSPPPPGVDLARSWAVRFVFSGDPPDGLEQALQAVYDSFRLGRVSDKVRVSSRPRITVRRDRLDHLIDGLEVTGQTDRIEASLQPPKKSGAHRRRKHG